MLTKFQEEIQERGEPRAIKPSAIVLRLKPLPSFKGAFPSFSIFMQSVDA